MSLLMKKDKPLDPVHIGLLGSITEMPHPYSRPYFIQKFWLDHFILLILRSDLVTRGDFAPRFLDTFLFEGRISDLKLE